MTDKRAKILNRVHKLLEQAAGTPFSEEANTARELADKLMFEYTIESWEVEKTKPRNEREKPATRVVFICKGNNPTKDGLQRLMSAVATHCRCKTLHHNFNRNDEWADYSVKLYGFDADCEYAEVLFTNLMMHLVRDLHPEYLPEKTWEENLVRFKEAGMKWQEMYPILRPHIPGQPEWSHALGVKFTSVYTKSCKERGIPRKNINPNTFVRSFVEGFAYEVDQRLWDLRVKQREYKGPGTDIVLRDRSKEVDDLFKQEAEGLGMIRVSQKKTDWAAREQGVRSGQRADLGQGRMAGKKELE